MSEVIPDKIKWKKAVNNCLVLLEHRKEVRVKVVEIALSVCVIKEGNNTSHKNYTLSAFAKDIGMKIGTLSLWKMEYENVYIKVKGKKKNFEVNRHALNQTMRRVKASTSIKEVTKIYKRYDTGYSSPEDKTLRVYTDRLRSFHYFICYGADLEKLDVEDLASVKLYCEEMLNSIKTKSGKLTTKPSRRKIKEATELLLQ